MAVTLCFREAWGWAAGQLKVKRGAEDGLPGRPLPAGGWSAAEKRRSGRLWEVAGDPPGDSDGALTPFDQLRLQSRALGDEDGVSARRELGGCASYSPGGRGAPAL